MLWCIEQLLGAGVAAHVMVQGVATRGQVAAHVMMHRAATGGRYSSCSSCYDARSSYWGQVAAPVIIQGPAT